jgi:hypothetical protein
LVGPDTLNFDAEVHKQFHMIYNDNHQLKIRLEAFNVLNHPNFGLPSLNILRGFGVISSAGPMRQMQLGAKYVF